MYAEPFEVAIGSETIDLARVGYNPGKFQNPSGDLTLSISHAATKNNRTRSIIRVDRLINIADPLTPTLVRKVKDTAYVVLDSASSATGITAAERVKTVQAVAWLLTDGAKVLKFAGGES